MYTSALLIKALFRLLIITIAITMYLINPSGINKYIIHYIIIIYSIHICIIILIIIYIIHVCIKTPLLCEPVWPSSKL